MAGVIDHDVICLNCGYNLRGVDPAGTCAECGWPIAIALREDYLSDAPVDWFTNIRRGARWVVVGTAISFPLINLGLILAAIGFWWMTPRQPERLEPRHDMLVRIFARGTLIPGAMGLTVMIHLILWQVWQYRFNYQVDWKVNDSLLIGFAGLFGIGCAAMAQYLRTLAERSGDASLVIRCQRLFWVWIAGGVCVIIIGGAVTAYEPLGQPWYEYHLYFAGLAMGSSMVLGLWLWFETLRTMRQFARVMQKLTSA